MRAREVNRAIERCGGRVVCQISSHRRYQADSGDTVCHTTVPQHPGDIPTGTLRAIERDLEPAFGRRWLR